MPLQDNDVMPWTDLADAFERLTDAKRALEFAEGGFDRALAVLELAEAEANLKRARDRMGLLAAAILHAAVAGFGSEGAKGENDPAMGYVLPKTWDKLADFMGVSLCFDMAKDSAFVAKRAMDSAMTARRECDALWDRIKALEEMLAKRTPGIGDPGLRVVG